MVTLTKGNRTKEVAPELVADLLDAGWKKVEQPANAGNSQNNRPAPLRPASRAEAAKVYEHQAQSRAAVPDWANIGDTITATITGFAAGDWSVTKCEATVGGSLRKFAVYFRPEHGDQGETIELEVRASESARNGKSWYTVA